MRTSNFALLMSMILVAILTIIAWYISGDLDDADQQARTYCRNVHDKVWPDYQGTYKMYCTPTGEWTGR